MRLCETECLDERCALARPWREYMDRILPYGPHEWACPAREEGEDDG